MYFLYFSGVFSSSGFAGQSHYEQGKLYGQGGVALGNPSQVDNGFLKRNQDTSHLQNMNDTTLSEQGVEAYKSQSIENEAAQRAEQARTMKDRIAKAGAHAGKSHSALQLKDGGNLLIMSERAKIDATNEHQINPQNAFLKGSAEIENDPLQQTGGSEIRQRSKVIKETEEFCEEGVRFEVDLVRQLVVIAPPSSEIKTMTVGFSYSGLGGYSVTRQLLNVPPGLRIHHQSQFRLVIGPRAFGSLHKPFPKELLSRVISVTSPPLSNSWMRASNGTATVKYKKYCYRKRP